MQSSHSSSLENSFAINHASPWSTALHPENSLLSVGRSFGRASAGVDSPNPGTIAFIDTHVADYQSLIAGLEPGTEVHLLDRHQSAIAQITDTLMGRSGIESVHIVSHGQAGSLQLGADWLSWETLRSYTGELQTWGNALSADADILLYGCDIAGGTIGQSFVQQMAQLTDADIAASDDRTGSAALGGDWNLEFSTGEISAASVFGVDTTATYQHVLSIELISGVNPNLLSDTANGRQQSGNVSRSGRYVTFTSTASNLITTATNGRENVFVRDLQTGNTILVSVNKDGTAGGNNTSYAPEISGDGRYIAFKSNASDLVANDTNGRLDVFVRDMQTGITQLVSVNSSGTNGGNGDTTPHIIRLTDDGRYVAFTSSASDLVANDNSPSSDVFVRDLQTGITTLVSINNLGTSGGNHSSGNPSITDNGRYITFVSSANDLVANPTTTDIVEDVFIRDMVSGTTSLVSVSSDGSSSGNSYSGADFVRVSDNGRYVVFNSTASNLVANDTNGNVQDLFVRDIQTNTTTLVSVNSSGTGSGNGGVFSAPSISRDGRYVAFVSFASDLVNNDTNNTYDVFVRDLVMGTTMLVSSNRIGSSAGNGFSGSTSSSSNPIRISGDGRYVVFVSAANDLVANDTNGKIEDVFVRDLLAGSTTLISHTSNGNSGNRISSRPSVFSGDGRYVVFGSDASNLVANDLNSDADVFLYDVTANTVSLVSQRDPNLISVTGNGVSETRPNAVSANGRYVAFVSSAKNLVINDSNVYQDVFLYDRQTRTTTLISVDSKGTGSGNRSSDVSGISADGRYVLFESDADNLVANDTNSKTDIFVRDLLTGITRLISVNSNGTGSGNGGSNKSRISSDGRYVTFTSMATNLVSNDSNGTTADIFVQDLVTGTTTLVSTSSNGTSSNSSSYTSVISNDGRYIAFLSTGTNLVANDTNSYMDVFLKDLVTGTTTLISGNSSGTNGGNGHSLNPVISEDGHYVSFWSDAGDLIAGDNNSAKDVFLWERQTGKLTLVSRTSTGNSGNRQSLNPVISRDGRYVAFSSDASNLVANDSNGFTPDVFVYDRDTNRVTLVSHSTTGSSGNDSSDIPVMSQDGRFIAFSSRASNLVTNDSNGRYTDIFVWDRLADEIKLVSQSSINQGGDNSSYIPVISASGAYIAFMSYATNFVAGDRNETLDIYGAQNLPPTVSINPVAVRQNEGTTGTAGYTFTVNLSHLSSETVTVDYITVDGTAMIANNDYTATSGTLTFNPGETSKTITVFVNGDVALEPDETFRFVISDPINGVITDDTSIATIANDDVPPTYNFSTSTFTVAEGNTTRTVEVVTVVRSGDVTIASSVDVLLKSGSATAGNDFTATPITVSFQAGETQKTVLIELRGDSTFESDETVLLSLSNFTADGVAGTDQPTATLTLKNDDLAPRIRSDFDGDGKADLVWRNYGVGGTDAGKVAIWTMNGVTPKETVTMPFQVTDTNWRIEGTGDFNADGQQDLVWRYYGTTGADVGKVSIWTMNGVNPVQTVIMPFLVPDVNWKIEGIADFDRDGKLDLVWRHYGTSGTDAGKVAIWTMNGVNPVQTIYMPFVVSDVSWKIDGVADFNNDGNPDLVWRHYGTSGIDAGKVVIWTMNGVSPMQTVEMPFKVSDTNWRIEGVGDFNGDGKADLVWRHYGTSGTEAGKVVIWTMNGINPVQTVEMPFRVSDPYWQIVL